MGRVRVLAAVTGAALLVASSCSSNDEPNVIAAGDTAEAVVIAALDAALAGSGRVEMRIEVDEAAMQAAMDAMAEQNEEMAAALGQEPHEGESWSTDDLDQDVVVEFDAEDYRVLGEDGQPTLLHVGGKAYQSVAAISAWRDEMFADLPDDSPSALRTGPQIPSGVEWVSIDPDSGGYPMDGNWSLSPGDEGPHLVRSDQLVDVVDAGASEVEGTATHRYTATLDEEAVSSFLDLEESEDPLDEESGSGDEAAPDEDTTPDDEYDERFSAMEEYLREHFSVEVSIHLDEEGRLLRTELSTSMEGADEYAECFFMTMSAMPVTVTADYSGLGEDVELAAPPAESVISGDEYDELENESFETWMESESGGLPQMPELPEGPSDRSWGPDGEPIKLATADGERYRADIEDDLVKFGSVIDLDPATVGDLDDAALVDAHDRASAAIAALPTTTTALGELTRVELLWNVKWGMETFGMDPAAADAMGDQELGALIDGFVGEQGVSGDGVWGDGPSSMAEMESEGWFDEELMSEDEFEAEEDLYFDTMFEHCPA